jgi:hypothetical protein
VKQYGEMKMKWQEFEKHVRTVASYKWDTHATPATINGVKVDCVLKLKDDYWVLVEITQDESLQKLRTDLAKFATVRPSLISQGIYYYSAILAQECSLTLSITSYKHEVYKEL